MQVIEKTVKCKHSLGLQCLDKTFLHAFTYHSLNDQ